MVQGIPAFAQGFSGTCDLHAPMIAPFCAFLNEFNRRSCLATKSRSEQDPVNTGILWLYCDCAICLLGFNHGTTPRRMTNSSAISSRTCVWTRLNKAMNNSKTLFSKPSHSAPYLFALSNCIFATGFVGNCSQWYFFHHHCCVIVYENFAA